MDFNDHENNEREKMEMEADKDLRGKVVEFVKDFDPLDDRDPYYVTEIIFGVPEDITKKWMREEYQKESATITVEPPKGVRSDIQRIVHSLESIRKSVLKLDEYNKHLIAELKRKMKRGKDEAR